VLTASVTGPAAEAYQFTSTLPLEVLRMLAPALSARLWPEDPATARPDAAPVTAAAGDTLTAVRVGATPTARPMIVRPVAALAWTRQGRTGH